MNEVEVTVRGNITSDIQQMQFSDGNTLTSFRVASNVRRWDANRREMVAQNTNFFTINCRRGLGANVMESLQKGQPVVVHGRLRHQRWTKDDRSGETMVVDADTIGHDLTFGVSRFSKKSRLERVDIAEVEGNDQVASLAMAGEDESRAETGEPDGRLSGRDFDPEGWGGADDELSGQEAPTEAPTEAVA